MITIAIHSLLFLWLFVFLLGAGEQFLAEQGSNPSPWSVDEQKILEQALKTYPASLADRWEKISGFFYSKN
jgi:hypothetical protein